MALGELLIDFTEAGHSQGGEKLFEQNPGGAGKSSDSCKSFWVSHLFIGKVGNDMHGKFLKRTLQTEGINTDAIVEDPIILQHWHLWKSVKMEKEIFLCKKNRCRYTVKKKEELDQTLISGCRIFHFGSLSLTDEPAESATIEAVKNGKSSGVYLFHMIQITARLLEEQRVCSEKNEVCCRTGRCHESIG